MRALAALLVMCATSIGCPASRWRAPDETSREGRAPLSLDGNRRLGRDVVPRHYALDLRIDPEQDRFSGRATIRIDVAAETRTILLHAADLDVREALVESAGSVRPATATPGPHGALALALDAPLPAGPAVLRLSFEGPLPETPFGLYRVREGGSGYAFTQFEPLEARRAFPCFDQPEFKTPFAVTLRVPRGALALANAPQIAHRVEPEGEVYVFADTKPLPTYLVAFAVGDLEVVSGVADQPLPLRVATVRGRGGLAHYALERTPLVLRWLADYFDRPYPFAKLDLVAVPNFAAGAMENAGLVTFRERLLLLDAETAAVWDRAAVQSVIAHELSHMWYGDLVTMAWWDDLWLNESFATWMAARVLADLDPALESDLDVVSSTQYTMRLDSKRDARRVRQPIRDGGDVYNAFDGITYGKGAAVLRMLESWIGEEAFRSGVRAYLTEHAYGSGGTGDLLAALERSSGQPVADTVAAFLDQPGTPLVDVDLVCEAGARPALHLRQTRYRPAGSDAPVGRPWTVPICVGLGYADPAQPRARECFRLEGREQVVVLSTLDECPRWVYPNAGERGYYRWSLDRGSLLALATRYRDELEVAERVALPGSYEALLEADLLPVSTYLEALRALAGDDHRQVVEGVARSLSNLAHAGIADDDSPVAVAFAATVRELLTPQIERTGIRPGPGESVDTRMRRATILFPLAAEGRDPTIRAAAREVAARFLEAPESVDEETLALLLPVAARKGDAALWNGLVRALHASPSPAVRGVIVSSLGSFEDARLLRRSLDLLVDGGLRAQDSRSVLLSVPAGRHRVAWTWLEERYPEIVARLGPMTATGLPRVAEGLCDEADRRRVATFFASVDDAPEGTERNVRLALEEIERCARLRARIADDLALALQVPPR